ncbi:cryptochrome/photolyase family protein [Cognatishimia maritima]|uniref:Deoxyribodipyrimidine photo-lyase n=1 Tax=Cognatishimia maritima TaxID=870908 RepID=A0A1M5L650_9RHOB|nr:deoxyribodipyrimidine photo-lyase [Cognatishimia maritima]SHG59903.1 deoxyribodipyrimidine photo-lyase [Cognatishimia maritima]
MGKHLHWFRKDLRLADNPALSRAAKGDVLPVYLFDPSELAAMGAASKVWLFHSLHALNQSLDGQLRLLSGPSQTALPEFVAQNEITTVTWTRRYDPAGIEMDQALKATLQGNGVEVHSLNGSLLWEPWDAKKPDGTPYRVFTPFYKRGCQAAAPPRAPLPAPKLDLVKKPHDDLALLDQLLPDRDWHVDMMDGWNPGEAGARIALEAFIDGPLDGYKSDRDVPAANATSRLSPHLHFGEISPNQIWHAIAKQPTTHDTAHFKSELAWREFSYHLLYRHPDLDHKNLNDKFDAFPWRDDDAALQRWQRGQTGIPIVDAGMRELWQTGYMHNRVRMIVASFLIKNLLIHWREGLAWFHDTLVDADPANNAASWQWVAGSGADAAPYFRIFNPVTQARKFDAEATYITTYVPELAALPVKHRHAPWEAPAEIRKALQGYPEPLVDLKDSRARALAAFSSLP